MTFFSKIRQYFRDVWEDAKARERGETRIAPRGTRGRIYAKVGKDPKMAGHHRVGARVKDVDVQVEVRRGDGSVERFNTKGRLGGKPGAEA